MFLIFSMKTFLDQKQLQKMRVKFHDFALIRREIIKASGDALHLCKRAIFALHREQMGEAEEKITAAEKIFRDLHTRYKKHPYGSEGSYKAAIEEYVEAKLFHQFIKHKKIGVVTTFPISDEDYLAGLCDLPGELYRYAIVSATNHKSEVVAECLELSSQILGELIEFNLTSYLRTKLDQAKQAAHKLEIVVYEVSLRQR